jgi:hypothetical protein
MGFRTPAVGMKELAAARREERPPMLRTWATYPLPVRLAISLRGTLVRLGGMYAPSKSPSRVVRLDGPARNWQ